MTTDFIRCECGKAHPKGARYCERCGAQPPRPHSTGRQDADVEEMTDEEAEAFVSFAIAANDALARTGGKWGVA